MKTDWSSLWKKEDWWAVWVGFLVLILGIVNLLPSLPVIQKWAAVAQSFPAGIGTLGSSVVLLFILLIPTAIGIFFTGKNTRKYALGFLVVFALTFIAQWAGKYAVFNQWGLETVLWALILGLIISNLWRVPGWLKVAVQAEFFIKTGLVLLGAEILFSTIAKGGAIAMGQALIVVLAVWFFAYWISRRLKLDKDFSAVLASGVSICGVSAAIASGGAVKGNPKHVSYVISLVLLFAMPMLVGMPILAKALGLPSPVAGAWMGGIIDTTSAVAAAGTLVDPKVALQVATLTKMAQNVLIGFAAFFLAIWSMFGLRKGEGASAGSSEKPRVIEIWYRLPKFILGFVFASLLFSFLIEPVMGAQATSAVIGVTSGYRGWFFALAFISIGLDTRFKDLIVVGKGKPILAFVTAQIFNVALALPIVWLLWSGVLFASPIK